jgi:hypothetical protein
MGGCAENRFHRVPKMKSRAPCSLRRLQCSRGTLDIAGKRYTAYFSVVPELSPGTLVATSYWCAVIARGHTATADELAAALDTLEVKRRSSEGASGGA